MSAPSYRERDASMGVLLGPVHLPKSPSASHAGVSLLFIVLLLIFTWWAGVARLVLLLLPWLLLLCWIAGADATYLGVECVGIAVAYDLGCRIGLMGALFIVLGLF